MLNIVTDKRANGRQLVILVLEPQEVDHIKRGQPLVGDSSQINNYDFLICYTPDGARLENLVAQQMPMLESKTFVKILEQVQMYPEIRRPMKTRNINSIRQAADKP